MTANPRSGYWTVTAAGSVTPFGGAASLGSPAESGIDLNKPIVGMAATPSGQGYWLVASDGGIFSYGDARFYGSSGAIHLNKPIVGMAATPSGQGYWLVASDGGIFSYGDARFYGSSGAIHLNKPIVGMAATPSGQGYWLVASDGGIFSYGDARFYGSSGAIHLNKPIVGMAATPSGQGYWLVASDGGIFSYGDAPYEGSFGGHGKVVIGIIVNSDTGVYSLVQSDGAATRMSGSSGDSTETETTQSSTTTTQSSTTTTQAFPAGSSTSEARTPIVGILGVSGNYFTQEKAAGIEAVTINVGWNDAEPSPGAFSAAYLGAIQSEIRAAQLAGLQVVLDPGLQYPPSWAFALPGGTRFVNQYGDAFTGGENSGENAINGVTDIAVRAAEGSFLAWLGSQIRPGEIIGIREGGGPLGELSYPAPDFDGHDNSYWAFDESSQAISPVPGWAPGSGNVTQAKEFLDSYNANLDNYGKWLNDQMGIDFQTNVLVLLPGWGERPGTAAGEESSLLTLNAPEFNEGLDWTDLLDSLPDAAHSVAYTTWLDAPNVASTSQLEDPADFIAFLTSLDNLRLGGENTGDGSVADLKLCIERAKTLDMYIVQWMDEAQLISSDQGQNPNGPTLEQLATLGT